MPVNRPASEKSDLTCDDFYYRHDGTDFNDVVRDVITSTPEQAFYFLNSGRLRDRAALFQSEFLPGDSRRSVAYAVKANSRKTVLKIVSEAGIDHFDCASVMEVNMVQSVRPDATILYNNPHKPQHSIQEAYKRGVRDFVAQSRSEIEKITAPENTRGDKDISVSVRLHSDGESAQIGFSEKYGTSFERAKDLIRLIRESFGCIAGVTTHVGSQNTSPDTFKSAIRAMAQVAAEVDEVGMFNVGGGIPVIYEAETKAEVAYYLRGISGAIRRYAYSILKPDSKIIIEPGRSMVGDSIDLVIPIIAREERGMPAIYIDDGVYTSFSDYPIHRWRYPFRALNRKGEYCQGKLAPYRVFGRTCDSGDNLGEVLLPDNLNEGDYLWVPKAGAYTDSQASHFNGFAPPLYVSYNNP